MNIPLIIYLEDLSRLMRLLFTGSRIPKPLKNAEKIIGRPIKYSFLIYRYAKTIGCDIR